MKIKLAEALLRRKELNEKVEQLKKINVEGLFEIKATRRNVTENIDDIIAKIKANKLDFDILVAVPSVMPKLAAVAKILGPKGLMPSPKTGTVVENTAEAAAEFKIGKVEYKQDDQKNIHMGIGKISWGKEKIKENLETIIKVLPKNKILAFYLTSTMGPSVKMELPR